VFHNHRQYDIRNILISCDHKLQRGNSNADNTYHRGKQASVIVANRVLMQQDNINEHVKLNMGIISGTKQILSTPLGDTLIKVGEYSVWHIVESWQRL